MLASTQCLFCCTGLFTDDFQSTVLPQAVVPKEIARATLQLLFLCLKSVLQAYKTVELHCMGRPPGDLTTYDSSLTQSQIAAKLAVLDSRPESAVKRQHAYLLDHRSLLGMCPGCCILLPLLNHRGFLGVCPNLRTVDTYSQEQAYMQVDSHLMHAGAATCSLWCIGPNVNTHKTLGLLRLNDPVRFGGAHANLAVITFVNSMLFCCS